MARKLSLIIFLSICVFATAIKKNILFLVADDMRPNLEAYKAFNKDYYSQPTMYTPNLDALASKSMLFGNAFTQESLCSPSRTSTLTGRRIDTTRVTHMGIYWRDMGGNFTSIPQFFRENGYYTHGGGKIYHEGDSSGDSDKAFSWDGYFTGCHNHFPTVDPGHVSWRAFTDKELSENQLEDTRCGDYAVNKLRDLAPKAKSGEQPFFLGVGMKKPHLPFYFPEKFLEHYPESDIDMPYDKYFPVGAPNTAWHKYRMAHYDDCTAEATDTPNIGERNITYPDWKIKEQRRAYYASLTHADNELGRVLNELKALGLEDNTIVSFWADHGYHLGKKFFTHFLYTLKRYFHPIPIFHLN